MKLKTKLILAGVLGGGCLLLLLLSFTNKGSVDSYIAKNYTAAAPNVVPGAASTSRTYTSTTSVTATADKIAGKWKPAEELVQPTGTFLRYKDRVVAVTPNTSGSGSFISIDDSRTGYTRWFPIIGGFWGTTDVGGGGAGGARGGGPGAGK